MYFSNNVYICSSRSKLKGNSEKNSKHSYGAFKLSIVAAFLLVLHLDAFNNTAVLQQSVQGFKQVFDGHISVHFAECINMHKCLLELIMLTIMSI